MENGGYGFLEKVLVLPLKSLFVPLCGIKFRTTFLILRIHVADGFMTVTWKVAVWFFLNEIYGDFFNIQRHKIANQVEKYLRQVG